MAGRPSGVTGRPATVLGVLTHGDSPSVPAPFGDAGRTRACHYRSSRDRGTVTRDMERENMTDNASAPRSRRALLAAAAGGAAALAASAALPLTAMAAN